MSEDETITKVCGSCYEDVQYVHQVRKRIQVTDLAIKNYYSTLHTKLEVEYLEIDDETISLEPKIDLNETEFKEIGHHEECIESVIVEENLSDDESSENESIEDETEDAIFEDQAILPEMDTDGPDEILPQRTIKRRKLNRYKCYICSTDFDTREKFDFHILSHIGSVSLVCSFCELELQTVRQLNRHLRVNHYNPGKLYPCKECEKNGEIREFSANYTLQYHIKRVHQGIVNPPELKHVCTYCGKRYPRASTLRIHENIHTKSVIYDCRFCSKFKTTSRSNLVRHERIHTSEKPSKCDICDARFTQSGHLRLHKAVRHSDERPFVCEICGDNTRFKTKKVLQQHMRTHSNDTCHYDARPKYNNSDKVEPFICRFCGKGFPRKQALTVHENIHTKSVMFECKYCSTFKSVSKSSLMRHERIHTADKRYECDLCGARFTQSNGLKLHKNTVHCEDRPFACDICDNARFKTKYILQAHMRTHLHNSSKGRDGKKSDSLKRTKPQLKCTFCPAVFYKETLLNNHVLDKHSDETVPMIPCKFEDEDTN
ncbi:zinc finger protein ZFP2-like isoform X2 [Topomyia yanbarensis]|nr:zinc finger protein ZFP2-like isoform X2 [Topomyia yanbarensis]XP_058826262.1 zinc finger protein ZFP2-like isoform X2 [Topomyia yanbarensis]